ncbi:UTRA domain-containing protein [Streptomyces sp. NPDC020800]|uniref:UTRA domain-containing protein n=1 Tax=Streptomyces sp. NPDC020800 TaxID=3365092 RepID=UPI0037897747
MVKAWHGVTGRGTRARIRVPLPVGTERNAGGRQGNWENRTDAKVPAPAGVAARLGIAEGDLCVRTTYEFLADGRPVQLSTSWEPYDLTAGTLVVLSESGPHAGAGVVNRMAAIGVTVSHAVEQPEPRQATAEEASILGIQKAALVMHIRRTYYSDQGRPVETADIVVPTAHCEIVYEIPINR